MGYLEISSRFEGVDDVREMLEKAERALSDANLAKHIHKGAEVFEDRLHETIPIGSEDDGDSHPGQLRDSVRIVSLGTSAFSVGPDMDDNEIKKYAEMVEFGGNIDALTPAGMRFMYQGVFYAGIMHTEHQPREYMQRAFDEGVGPAGDKVIESISQDLAE